MKASVRLVLVLSSSLLLSACANFTAGNLFSDYSTQNAAVYQAVKQGDYVKAKEKLPDEIAGDILDNFEKGRVYLLGQDYTQSQDALGLSDSAVRVEQDKAVVSISDTASSVGALAANDNLKTYQPVDYELGFLHLYLGLNYVKANQLDDALVEMRRANQVQEQAKKDRERALASAEKEMKSKGLTPNLGSVLAKYPDAGKTLQAVQNAYLMYLSALLFEADNDLNSAYVDYRRALAVMPDNRSVIDSTMRVAKRLGMREDLRQLEQRYGKTPKLNHNQARVIVFQEQGIVDALQGWKLSLPLYDSRGNGALYSLALPYYPSKHAAQFSAPRLNQQALSQDLLADVNLMAQRDLSERMPNLVIRQALRVVAKDQLRKETTKGDDVGNLIFNVWNTLTEQPDTRSWQTLPASIYASSTVVEAGEQQLDINGKPYNFSVSQGQTVLVWLSRQGNNATLWHKQLGRL
ncbi:COG3014 family protein [Vibrio renipiscarius]|uniref:Lipoprotein n=1 Tax=Vibrio renipiscarius TaxID=1461322 RepID=A0A0C2NTW4_9VIBR|nr:lipoprotein [Vibrio renipiscarius]KII79610.1 lipoprotein [Vibrio renipiscarius]KII80762.1 lipoprotein [Vibrio renipiscarius]